MKFIKNQDNSLLVMLVASVVALIGSFVLSIETMHHLKNPDEQLSCSVNLFVNCATVMDSWQAELLGFPNIFVGLMGFSVLITLVVVALSGVRLPKWMVASTMLAVALAFIFLIWLIYSSVYVIGVLCPWCLVVGFSTIFLLGATYRWGLKQNAFCLPKKSDKRVQSLLNKDYDKLAVAFILVIFVAVLIINYAGKL